MLKACQFDDMDLNRIGKWVAGLGCAAVLIAVTGCHTTRYERTTGEFADDQMLTRRVKHALNAQPVYKYPDVRVHTYRGIVQIGGFVASDQQREAASEIAQKVRGVQEVQNVISLAPLAGDSVRNYIPGRDVNDTNRTSLGAPSTRGSTESGSTVTNAPVRTEP